MTERRLKVLIALGDVGRAERLAAAVAGAGDMTPVLAEQEDGGRVATDVSVVDGSSDAPLPYVLLRPDMQNVVRSERGAHEESASGLAEFTPIPNPSPQGVGGLGAYASDPLPLEGRGRGGDMTDHARGISHMLDQAAAILPADADDVLVIAAARLAATGYSIVRRSGRRAEAHSGVDHDPFAEDAHDDTPIRPVLSAREREVLSLLAEGAPNKVIARRLDISVHTAKFHVAAILAKLGAANRTDAIGIAMRQGLVLV